MTEYTLDDCMKILLNIEKRLDNIENILEENNKSAMKMSNHIDFIDNVYDTVRKPFSRVLSICSNSTVEIQDRPKMIENKVLEK